MIIKSISYNKTIQELDIRNTEISNNVKTKIDDLILENRNK